MKNYGWLICLLPLLVGAKTIDLTHSMDDATLHWPSAEPFHFEYTFNGIAPAGFFYSAGEFSSAEHVGTHLDAPFHFNKKGLKAGEIPLDKLMGRAIVIDVTKQAEKNSDYLISITDFHDWESINGKIQDNTIVLLNTGYGKKWPNRKEYSGTDETGVSAIPKLHFPGLDPAAAKWLTEQRNVKAIGIDTLSVDYGQSKLFNSHQVLTAADVPIFENVADLTDLPAKGFTVIALPMKIAQGTGAPLRIIAKVD